MSEGLRHDARIWRTLGAVARPYGWHCAACGKNGKNYATGMSAERAAAKHNGGQYNYPDGWDAPRPSARIEVQT